MKHFAHRFGLALGAAFLAVCCAGCSLANPEPERTLRGITKAYNDLADTLESVQDAESASAAAAELDAEYSRLISLLNSVPELMRKYKDKRVSKQTLDNLNRNREAAEQRFQKELERLDRIRGLPLEFWKVVRVNSADLIVAGIDLLKGAQGTVPEEAANFAYNIRDLLKAHGHERVVNLELDNLSANVAQRAYDKIRAAAPGATLYHFSDGNLHDVFVGPVDDYQAVVAGVDFGTIEYQDEGRRALRVEVDRRKLGARANTDAEEIRLSREEAEREAEQRRQQIEADRKRREEEWAARERERKGPDPTDPDYHEKLVERMSSDNKSYRDDALKALLKIQPDDVPSQETRGKIARAFKDVAFGEDRFPDERRKGIQGMVVWGGQFAVPLLLELLADDPAFLKDELYDALGELKDARAAGPMAAKLGNFLEHRKAYDCLRRIGPAAEDALLEVAPSNDPKVCLAAIELLGEVGTAKSYPTLREGLRSRNPEVKAAVKLALQKIRQREQPAEDP